VSGGFFRSTSIVGAFTLISRVSGLLRDMVYSRMFGAGVLMDAFLVAFKIPNFMRRLFAEGAFSQAFVPVVSEYKVQRSHDEVRELVDGAAGTMAWFLSVVTIIGVVAAPLLVLLFAPGFREDAGKFDLTVEMLRWTFPYLLFVSLAALAAGVLNSYQRFAVPATTSTLMNLVMIVFAAFIAPHFERPGIALAIGDHLDFHVAGLLQVLFQVHHARAEGGGSLGLGDLDRVDQGGLIVHHAHTAAPAAGGGLDDDRVTDGAGDLQGALGVIRQRAIGARYGRHPGTFHGLDGAHLVAHQANGFSAGADKGEA